MSAIYQPVIKSFNRHTKKQFDTFLADYNGYHVLDVYAQLTKDGIAVAQPDVYFLAKDKKEKKLKELYAEYLGSKQEFQLGQWVANPLLKEIYHLIDQDQWLLLRTVRNRNVITKTEQIKLYYQKVLLVGLSVGSNVLTSLVRLGVGSDYTLVDYDKVDSHNLNRTQFFLRDIGTPKIHAIAKIVWSIDPYINLKLIEEQLAPENLSDLVVQHSVIIDAFDHFEGKISLRKQARMHRKPVISGWDVGDGMVIIVERYDKDQNLQLDLFLNNISLEEVLSPTSSLREKIEIFVKIIGKETHDERMLASVYSIGTELSGIPQNNIATSLTSAVFSKVAVDIILDRNAASFRKHLDLNALIYS